MKLLTALLKHFKIWWQSTIIFTIWFQIYSDIRWVKGVVYPILLLFSIRNFIRIWMLTQHCTVIPDQLPADLVTIWIEGVVWDLKQESWYASCFTYFHTNITCLVTDCIVRVLYPHLFRRWGVIGQILFEMGPYAWATYPVFWAIYYTTKYLWLGMYPTELSLLIQYIEYFKLMNDGVEKNYLLGQIMELFEILMLDKIPMG